MLCAGSAVAAPPTKQELAKKPGAGASKACAGKKDGASEITGASKSTGDSEASGGRRRRRRRRV